MKGRYVKETIDEKAFFVMNGFCFHYLGEYTQLILDGVIRLMQRRKNLRVSVWLV